MRTAALWILLSQDPVLEQVDDSLRRFEEAVEASRALGMLAALGEPGTDPIARRLVEDLRDGMASASAPALIDALSGRPDGLPRLQEAFRDGATSASGRIELASALRQLEDVATWRQGLRAIADDPGADPELRRRAARLLGDEAVEPPAALLDEPRFVIEPDPPPARPSRSASTRKNQQTEESGFFTLSNAVAGGMSMVLLAALVWQVYRKG